MWGDILTTGYKCGVLNGCVKPGDTVALIGTCLSDCWRC